ncbi:MAG: hypothetical protein HC846_12085 [Blastocatellia bacterium]|nr:hypothetical protein [Blastocatellia bacterium]
MSLFDLFATKSAQVTNDLVKRLTFVTIILGVLGVIAGIFGMNLEAKELFEAEGGFWLSLGGMILIAVALTLLAKFKKWI